MIIVYLLFVAAAFLFYIQYIGPFSFCLFIFALAAPLINIIINFRISRKMTVSFESASRNATRATNVPIKIKIANSSRFSVPNCRILITMRSELNGAEDHFIINTPVFPKNEQALTFRAYCKHYGAVTLELEKVKVYDFLRISGFRLKKSNILLGRTKLMVLPDFQVIENPISNYSELGLESDEYSKEKKGDDPSEIFDLHTYNEGDKLSRVHWKLSAKQDDLIVKDYSLPITNAITIAADLSGCEYSDQALDRTDAMLDSVAALSLHLAEQKVVHNLLWSASGADGFVSEKIDSIEACRAAINKLVNIRADEAKTALTKILPQIYERPMCCAHLIYCCYSLDSEKLSELAASGFAYKYSALSPNIQEGLTSDETTGIYRLLPGAAVASTIGELVI